MNNTRFVCLLFFVKSSPSAPAVISLTSFMPMIGLFSFNTIKAAKIPGAPHAKKATRHLSFKFVNS